jgi:adenylate kinase family enzyme
MRADQFITEAANPAQQAAIAIAMKKAGKKPKSEDVIEGVNDPHIFKCIFLFGPMGAGKSTVARPLLTHTGLRSVNLDNFNEMFIKKGQVPTGHLAPDQLEKSWQLSQTQQQNFMDSRLGIIIDGSGRNPNTAIGVIEKLQPLGYEFMMIFVNVSEATSIARQQSRADKQQQQWGVGRQVDPTLAKDTYAQVQKHLSKYSAYFGPQRFVYVDNENTPDLTQATKKVDAFLNAPITSPKAIEWINSQKGGQQVAQRQQKLATAQNRQQQALKQYNPLNPKFTKSIAKEGLEQDVAEDWNKANRKDKTSGMSRKAVKAYRRENPGSKLQTAVTTKPSKLKPGSKAAKRRKSFCARMSGNKGPMKKPNGKPTPKALALRRWNCESVEQMEELVMLAEQYIRNLKK